MLLFLSAGAAPAVGGTASAVGLSIADQLQTARKAVCEQMAGEVRNFVAQSIPVTMLQLSSVAFAEAGRIPLDAELLKSLYNMDRYAFFDKDRDFDQLEERDRTRARLSTVQASILHAASKKGMSSLREEERRQGRQLAEFQGFVIDAFSDTYVSDTFLKAFRRIDPEGFELGKEGFSREQFVATGIKLPPAETGEGTVQWALNTDPTKTPREQIAQFFRENAPADVLKEILGADGLLAGSRNMVNKQTDLMKEQLKAMNEAVAVPLANAIGSGQQPPPVMINKEDIPILQNQINHKEGTGEVKKWLDFHSSADAWAQITKGVVSGVVPDQVSLDHQYPGAFVERSRELGTYLVVPRQIDSNTGKVSPGCIFGDQYKLRKSNKAAQESTRKRLLGEAQDGPGKKKPKTGKSPRAQNAERKEDGWDNRGGGNAPHNPYRPYSQGPKGGGPGQQKAREGFFGATSSHLVPPSCVRLDNVCRYFFNGLECRRSNCNFVHTGRRVTRQEWEKFSQNVSMFNRRKSGSPHGGRKDGAGRGQGGDRRNQPGRFQGPGGGRGAGRGRGQ